MSIKKIISLLLVLACIFTTMSVLSGCNESDDGRIFMYKVDKNNLLFVEDNSSYVNYLDKNKGIDDAKESIKLSAQDVKNAYSEEYLLSENDISYAFLDNNSKWVEWEVEIPSDAFYTLWLDYKTLTNNASDISVAFTIDGETPYSELQNLSVFRLWKDSIDSEFEKDSSGNDIRPTKSQVNETLSSGFFDDKGYYSENYGICLKAGKHTIRIESVTSEILIENLVLKTPDNLMSYKEYSESVANKESMADEKIVIEAEHPLYTNSSSIYAISDWQDVNTTPNSPTETRLNTIGDANWRYNGQRITWSINVEKEGYYSIVTRFRQDYSEGLNTYRKLYIDDEIPFEEAKSLEFKYGFEWENGVFGGDKPYYIWLDEGLHTISLEVSPSHSSDILLELDSLINDLNTIYRKIVIITGTTVDIYQDYNLEQKIPELLDSFKDCTNRIRLLSKEIKELNSSKGSIASVLDEQALLLDKFIEHPYEISGGLATYKTNVDDIASLLTNMSQQSLLIDKIVLTPKEGDNALDNASFFQRLKFSLLKFADSYSKEESKESDKVINVWVSTGRDQAQIIKQMISNEYEQNSDVEVQLSIVDTGSTLIQAALAGKGPDVALSIPIETPVNLAMRDGLVNLKELGIDDIYDQFYDSAWTQLIYEDGIYGIPETQVYDMMFIREDIFKEIGIEQIPQTWDDFYKCVEKIQNNNLMVGIGETNGANIAVSGAIGTFSKMYFQRGGTFFNEDHSAATFNSELAIDCMDEVCQLYSKYGLDRQFDFFNRFRSGELVMGISSYNLYNQLVAAAPEINGTWSMYPIPGTLNSNGEIDRSESSTGTASIILKAAEEREVVNEAWDFIKWWTGSEAQAEYAERLEGVMGAAARYTPANIKAFNTINWSEKEKTNLIQQWESVYNVREIPGNYYISRSLTSAIRNTISGNGTIRFNLEKYTNDINSEILRKREEFGLQ